MGSESSSSRYCSTRECSRLPGSGISCVTFSARAKGNVLAGPARAQALVSGSLARSGQRCAILLRYLWAGLAEGQHSLKSVAHALLSPSVLPIPARSAASPCPEMGKPAGSQGSVWMSLPSPTAPMFPGVSVASPESPQPRDLYTVISHPLEWEKNLPVLQKRAKRWGFAFKIS